MGKTVKVCILENGPVMLATKRVTALVNAKIVDTIIEADLVVAENMRDIESSFSKNKHYAIITVAAIKKVPDNIVVFKAPFELSDYYKFIHEILEKIDEVVESEEEVIFEVPLLPDAKRILVIDDMHQNIISARKFLAGHKLTVVDGYERAMEILGKEKFDVVLTDLYLPMSSRTLSNEAFRIGEQVPYGFLLMCEAARNGASYVAIVTDIDHHNDHFSAAFDHFSRFVFKIENAKVKMLQARMENGSKDWQDALKRLI